jgi:small subunit ribosomal protein S20
LLYVILVFLLYDYTEEDMANLPAAKKSIRQDKKRRLRNLAMKSELKTLMKSLNALINANKPQEAAKVLSSLMSKLDKAAKRKIIKRHTADRKKSRISRKIAGLKK